MGRICRCGCGRSLDGRNGNARFFEAKCRKRDFKGRRDGLTPAAQADPGFGPTVTLVLEELKAAGRSETWLAAVAVQLARRVDESNSVMGYAALTKDLRLTMGEALAGAKRSVSLVDELKVRRDRKRAG